MTQDIDQKLVHELPVDEVESQLSYVNGAFPKEAVLAAINQKSLIIPKLLTFLGYAIDKKSDLDNNYIGHLFSLFLLSQFQEKKAFPLIMKLARLEENELDALIGDCITEDLHRFIAATYDGNLSTIKSLIEDVEVNEWSRKAGLKSLVVLAKMGRIEKGDVVNYISSLFSHPSFIDDYDQITHLVTVSCDFEPNLLKEEIKKAFEDQKVDEFMIDEKDFNRCLTQPKKGFIEEHYEPIEDTISEMESWICFQDSNEDELSESIFDTDYFNNFSNADITKQVVRDGPKIGRNDPCPCSSGKKYKKCCLSQQ